MADAKLGILLTADPSGLTSGVSKANATIAILERQFERLQKLASLPNLSFKQQERLNQLLGTTGKELDRAKKSFDLAAPGLSKFTANSNAATNSLINLGRVAQDAPFGFLGIANNLNPLLESFQRLKASTGSTGGALKALGSSLTGAGGLGLALSVASTALIIFGDKLGLTGKTFKDADFEAANFKITIDRLKNSFDLFRSNLEFGDFFKNIKLQLSGVEGKDLELFDLQQVKESNRKILNQLKVDIGVLDKNIADITSKIVERGGEATQLLGGFSDPVTIPDNLISKLGSTNQQLFQNLKAVADRKKELQKEEYEAYDNIARADLKTRLANYQKQKEQQEKSKSDYERFVNETISLAQALQSEFPALFPPTYFSALDSVQDKFKKASSSLKVFFNDLKTGFLRANTSVDITAVIPIDVEPPSVTQMRPVSEDTVSALTKLFKEKPVSFTIVPDFDPVKSEKIKAAAEDIVKIFNSSFLTLFEGIGEGIGDAISGNVKGLGQSIIQSIGGLIQEIGKALVKYGAIKLGLDKLLGPGGFAIPGGAAIALGLTAIAFGQIFKNFAGARAQGGPVGAGRSYLIGERGPELFVPQASGTIIPNHNISGIQGFAQTIEIVGQTRTTGHDLLTVWHRATRYNTRNT